MVRIFYRLMSGIRRRNLKQLITDSSTYGAPVEGGKLGGDPFVTGPFAARTKLSVYFDQGDNAEEEARRRKISPETTTVSLLFDLQFLMFNTVANL